MKKVVKVTVAGLTDPVCPKCNVEMYGVSAMTFGVDKKFKNYAQCPKCNYKTKGVK